MSELENLVTEIMKKLTPEIKNKLTDWGKIVQVNINSQLYHINFGNNFDLIPGSHQTGGDFTISSSLETFSDIINGSLNPVEAVVSGEVSIDGSLTTALEFSEIIQNIDI